MSEIEEITKKLLDRHPLPSLLAPPPVNRSKQVSSRPWDETLRQQITSMQQNSNVPIMVVAALHLFNDDIGSCHDIVEKRSGHAIADYLHYLLHRREGDYWNAKWWIRQLKSEQFQSIYLNECYQTFSQSSKRDRLDEARHRAQAFVDRCEQIEKQSDKQGKQILEQLQWNEMKNVLDFARNSI